MSQLRVDVVQNDGPSDRRDDITVIRLVKTADHPCVTNPCKPCKDSEAGGAQHDRKHHGEGEITLMTEAVRGMSNVDSYTLACVRAEELRMALGLLHEYHVDTSCGSVGNNFTVWALDAQQAMIKATKQRPELFTADTEVRIRRARPVKDG